MSRSMHRRFNSPTWRALPAARRLAVLACAALLTACAGLPTRPGFASETGAAQARAITLPTQWQAPLPHAGQLADLTRWWDQFEDPVLTDLVVAAQTVSPTIAQAASRIEQSRTSRVAAGAALLPALDAQGSVSRGRQDVNLPAGDAGSVALQAGWELDVFGGNRAGRDAAEQRLAASEAAWHDARVAVAAELATRYVAHRACEALVDTAQADLASRRETSRLTDLSARAGFEAPASAALARAGAAQAASQLTAQRAQCELEVKALVALTGFDEPTLRLRLAPGRAKLLQLPQPARINVTQVPAQALAQRPDVFQAERELLASGAEVAQAQARRLPRVSLSGSVGAARFASGGFTADGAVWSLGPLAVSLPLFDGGTLAANVSASQARAVEAAALYRATLRNAVREVEESLINLQSAADRWNDASIAVAGFEQSLTAAEARFRGGLGSLFELEDARRTAVQAQSTLVDVQRQRTQAWIGLYRALGGGWSSEALAPAPTPAPIGVGIPAAGAPSTADARTTSAGAAYISSAVRTQPAPHRSAPPDR